jgi:hypothetical protein
VRELQNIAEALAIRSRSERRVTEAHLAEVFRSMNIDPARGPAPVEKPRTAHIPQAGPPGVEVDRTTGEYVCRAWREANFNLLEASRRLRAQRQEGQRVPLVDRAQMSHYVDGEILRAYLECGSAGDAIERLAGQLAHRHRVQSRVRRVLAQLASALETGAEAFPRLPEEYRDLLDELAAAGPGAIRESLEAEAR